MTSVDDYHTALIANKEKLKKDVDFSMASLVTNGFKTTGIAIGVWLWGYLGMSVAWVFVILFFHIVSGEVGRQIKSKRKFALQSMNCEKGAILSRVDERQSWIYFPELERAEWLNKMIKQLWPVIASYAENLIMTTIQECIQAYMPANLGNFKFTHIDMGDIPVRIEWVKVYVDASKKEEIIMDLNIKYEGDSSIKCEVKGISFGIKTLQVRGNMRVVMNPLISEVPIVGGLSAFFLNTPDIDFDMLAAANLLDLPVIKRTIRDIVSKVVSDMLVLPRRIPISLNPHVDLSKIRYPPADGLVVVHVVEAKDLRAADVNLIGKSKSDPYCSVTIGNQVMKTKVVQNKLDPNWNEFFQAVVDQRQGQSVDIRVYDHDQGSANDDDLGNASLDIDLIAKKGQMDMWIPLANVATGSLHVRALWMDALNTMNDYQPSASVIKSKFANAILMIVVESASNLPISENTGKPRNPYVRVRLGEDVKMTSIKHTMKDPEWNENFNYFLSDPQTQQLELQLMHKGSSKELLLGHVVVPVNAVLLSKDLSMIKTYQLPEVNKDCSLTVRFVLRVLKSTTNADEWSNFSGLASIGYGALMKPSFESLSDHPCDGESGGGGGGGGGFMNIDFGELGRMEEETPNKNDVPVSEALQEDDVAVAASAGGGVADGGGVVVGGGVAANGGVVASGGVAAVVGLKEEGGDDVFNGGVADENRFAGSGVVGRGTVGSDGVGSVFGYDMAGSGTLESGGVAYSEAPGESGLPDYGGKSDSLNEMPNEPPQVVPPSPSPSEPTPCHQNPSHYIPSSMVKPSPTFPNMAFDFSSPKQPSKFGKIQMTIRYSANRSTLVLVVHQCRNLIPCDKDNLADPYIRTYLLPDRTSDSKRKTKTVKNSLNPLFDETFEWVVGNMELPFRTLEVAVKNDVSMFSRGRVQMGVLMLKLKQLEDPSQALTKWFDLEEVSE